MIRLPHRIETYSGLEFDYYDPEIRVEDVAHGLSQTCRFAAQTRVFYSVAEHSVLVALLVERMDPSMALGALWHDAHEAYLGDCPTPLKGLIGETYHAIADGIDKRVRQFLGLPSQFPFRHPAIKAADEMAMLYEASILMAGPGWDFARKLEHETCVEMDMAPLGRTPPQAKNFFMWAHERWAE